MKKVAILGRPNVGKSSLFNRLIKKREAITSDISGTTRDIKKRVVEDLLEDREFELIDTGGLDKGNELYEKIKEKSLKIAKDADIIIYMSDGKKLPQDEDKEIFWELQALNKPIALVVNKIDNDKEKDNIFWEFMEFGTKDIFPISVSHNRGVNALLEWLKRHIPPKESLNLTQDEDIPLEFLFEEKDEENSKDEVEDKDIKVAIIGKVNSGKSSLLNALVKDERSIVSDIAGTTIDPVDEEIIYKDYNITFVDTAGIRRKGKIEGLEKYALNRTQKMLQSADIALLVIDATKGVTELDEKIAGLIDEYQLGAIIVLNKWDIRGEIEFKDAIENVRDKLKFLHFAPIITISAKSGKRVHKILDMIIKVFNNYKKRIPTSTLNQLIKEAQRKHQIPSHHGQVVNIKYAVQYDIKPPKIALISNKPHLLHFSYKRYLANFLRERIDFEGTPLIIEAKGKKEKEAK
ncbi:MAG: ribosome biogenesis GTPase Der [Epsilonproteobacteria bacterium]|nr:ribosome biogenesis GTPase Der [Campylobacterota bacterium]